MEKRARPVYRGRPDRREKEARPAHKVRRD